MKTVISALLLASLAGCTSLDAVTDISDRLVLASDSWDIVGEDIAASCARQRAINPAIEDCRIEQTATDNLAEVNALLEAYFMALGAAASETSFTVEPGLERATSAVANIPGVRQDQVAAVSGLFGVLARLATGAMRERTLRRLIDEGAPPAERVIAGMGDIVVPELTTRLSAEAIQLDSHSAGLIAAEGADIGSDPRALCTTSRPAGFNGTAFLLSLEYCDRRRAVAEREEAVAEYSRSLNTATEALAELQSSTTRLGSTELAARLFQTGAELTRSAQAVRDAFT